MRSPGPFLRDSAKVSAPLLWRRMEPVRPTPTGAGSATKIPTPSKSGAPAESSAETAAAELPRRQQIAAKLEKEAGLLDAIISTVPTVDGVEPPTTVLHLEEMK